MASLSPAWTEQISGAERRGVLIDLPQLPPPPNPQIRGGRTISLWPFLKLDPLEWDGRKAFLSFFGH